MATLTFTKVKNGLWESNPIATSKNQMTIQVVFDEINRKRNTSVSILRSVDGVNFSNYQSAGDALNITNLESYITVVSGYTSGEVLKVTTNQTPISGAYVEA